MVCGDNALMMYVMRVVYVLVICVYTVVAYFLAPFPNLLCGRYGDDLSGNDKYVSIHSSPAMLSNSNVLPQTRRSLYLVLVIGC